MTKTNLIGTFTEGNTSFPTLGVICWWNVRNLEITQDNFATFLKEVGLKDIYAKEHNYRSAFIRAIRNMEEKRIVRKVSEDSFKLLFQFTAENKVGQGTNAKLAYDPETVLVVDKEVYRKTGVFEQALISGKAEIKAKVIKYFYEEKTKYNSSDMTRYVQKILETEADIISLRDQGNVYFVPFAYQNVIEKLVLLFNKLPGQKDAFEAIPLPNVQAGRRRVSNSFVDEVEKLFATLEAEVTVVQEGDKQVTQKWVEERMARLRQLQRRLELYGDVVEGPKKASLETNFENLKKALEEPRMLDLGDEEGK